MPDTPHDPRTEPKPGDITLARDGKQRTVEHADEYFVRYTTRSAVVIVTPAAWRRINKGAEVVRNAD